MRTPQFIIMPKISSKKQAKLTSCKKNSSLRKEKGRKPEIDPFRLPRYPKCDLHIVIDVDRTLIKTPKEYIYGGEAQVDGLTISVRPKALDFVKFCCKIATTVKFISYFEISVTKSWLKEAGFPATIPVMGLEDMHKVMRLESNPMWLVSHEGDYFFKNIPLFNKFDTIIIDNFANFYIEEQRLNTVQVLEFTPSETPEKNDLFKRLAEFLLNIKKKKKSIPDQIKELEEAYPDFFIPKLPHYPRFKVVETRRKAKIEIL